MYPEGLWECMSSELVVVVILSIALFQFLKGSSVMMIRVESYAKTRSLGRTGKTRR